ncbi:MAG: hypothetical protein ABIX46_12435 [Burkholderiaceae bacterium]
MVTKRYYADERRAQMSCAMDVANHRRATLVGSAGSIDTEFLNPTAERPGSDPRGDLADGDHVAIERAARTSLDIAATLEAPGPSARLGRTVELGAVAGRATGPRPRAGRRLPATATDITTAAAAASPLPSPLPSARDGGVRG